MVAANPRRRIREPLPSDRQQRLPFRADPDPPPATDGPEPIGAILQRLLRLRGLDRTRRRFRR